MRAAVFLGALLLAVPVSAQTTDERLQKARDEVNLVENTANRAVSACTKAQYAKCLEEAKAAAKAASRALYAIDKARASLTPPPTVPPVVTPPVVTPPVVVPPVVTPPVTPPAPTFPKVGDILPIPSNFDPATLLERADIPASNVPDVVGAFRFLCAPAHIGTFDPIVYPGQPGKGHLHQFFGNDAVDASSTYASLRETGASTCQNEINRSAYWIPAMLNGKGQVVRPDYVSVYYKRRPLTDPVVSDPSNARYQGKAVPLPNGLRFIFGRNMLDLADRSTGNVQFGCDGPVPFTYGLWHNLEELQKGCPVGNRIGIRLEAPDCWDGVNLDSPDHRSHISYGSYGDWGYYKCPTTHPFVIPAFTMGVWYTQAAGETYELTSDHMDMSAEHRRGDTFHGDFFMAWDPKVHDIWEANCLNKLLSCVDGNVGNGQAMKRNPFYPGAPANPRLVPIP